MSEPSLKRLDLLSYDLFLFDFDGLLVDTERLHFAAYQALCRAYHLEFPGDFASFCQVAHRSSEHLRKELFARLPALGNLGKSWEELYAQKKTLYHQLMTKQGVPLMPGVAEFLAYLFALGKRCCVVTHSSLNEVAHIREQHACLLRIPHWLTREDYDLPKPAPDGYKEAIKRYLPAGGRAIGFEDTPRGILSLRQTPAQPVLVTSMEYEFFSPDEQRGVLCCRNLPELLPI